MDKSKLLPLLTIEDIESPLKPCAASIGTENLYKLCEAAGGKRLNIPKSDALFKNLIKRLIIKDYKSGKYTMEALAERYGICVKTVHTYIHG